jgi:hypothetical protein
MFQFPLALSVLIYFQLDWRIFPTRAIARGSDFPLQGTCREARAEKNVQSPSIARKSKFGLNKLRGKDLQTAYGAAKQFASCIPPNWIRAGEKADLLGTDVFFQAA